MKKLILVLAFCPIILYGQETKTEVVKMNRKVAVILKVGTTGISPEVSYNLNSRLNVRGSFSFLNYNRKDILSVDQNGSKVEVQYDAKLKLGNAGLLADFYPFKKFVAITGGIFYNLNSIDLGINPQSDLKFNDRVFTPTETGTLGVNLSYKKIAPYAGLSFGNANRGKVKFLFDVGTLFTGSPIVAMRGTGSIEPTATQSPILQANLKPLYLYPVVKLGMSVAITK